MRELLIRWLHQALSLKNGEEIYLPADTKDAQKKLQKLLNKELDVLKQIDAENGSKLHVIPAFKDARFWIILKKIETSPLIGFKKGEDGTERVILDSNAEKERSRRIKLMSLDGMNKVEIEAIEGILTEEDEVLILNSTKGD